MVNFIYRINTSGILMKKYTPPKKYMENSIYMDRKTSLIVVNCDATTYPLTRL